MLKTDGSGNLGWASVTGGGSSTTINNNANNRIITGSGTSNTLEGESTLTFDSNTLSLLGDGSIIQLGANSEVKLTHVHDTGIEISTESAVTNASVEMLSIKHTTSGTPATGIGAGISFTVETLPPPGESLPNFEKGMVLETETTDVSSSSEDFDMVVKLMDGGSAAAERLRVKNDGVISTPHPTDTYSGAGFPVFKYNLFRNLLGGEQITTIQIAFGSTNLGDGTYVADNHRKIIGKYLSTGSGSQPSYFYKIVKNNIGIVYKFELICHTVPTGGSVNIGIAYDTVNTLKYNDNPGGSKSVVDADVYEPHMSGKVIQSYSSSTISALNSYSNTYLYLYAYNDDVEAMSASNNYTSGKFLVKIYSTNF